QSLPAGAGLHIIQSFEPVPLYAVMADLGFQHETRERDGVFHVYFYKTATLANGEAADVNDAFKTIDARQEDPGSFLPSVITQAQSMQQGEILHIIQSFEPTPLYDVLGKMGFEYQTEQDANGDFHVYFYRMSAGPSEDEIAEAASLSARMSEYIDVEPERIEALIGIVQAFYDGEDVTLLRQRFETEIGTISPVEFAFLEQKMTELGISDAKFKARVEELLSIFKRSLEKAKTPEFPPGHPIHTFKLENKAIATLVEEMRAMAQAEDPADEAWWQEALDKLWQVNIHYVRKENQLFPLLEKKGFDKPSKVMWELHDDIRAAIKKARKLLDAGDMDGMLAALPTALDGVMDMIFKEEKILWPTSLSMLQEDEWIAVRRGEEELGYCLIDPPPAWPPEAHTPSAPAQKSAVSPTKTTRAKAKPFTPSSKKPRATVGAIALEEGYLTPEQISLVLQHLPLDITFIDEFDEVKYVNHGEQALMADEETVAAFKAGALNETTSWNEEGGRFVYHTLIAIRDTEGNYKGILQVTQDVTDIRALEGERRFLDWE
ncbi:MAG TPA: DUF2249 domain-containing protein, partial [Anaerolineae bacterium]|nr:DUF2249 domain-containing protein [Anaerolineae bacterium]